jgi:hypothetical protein
LINNAILGKGMESVCNRKNFHHMCSNLRAKKFVAKPTFKYFDIIKKKLTLIEMSVPKVTLNKSIFTGFCVFKLSKELIYTFFAT